MRLSSFIVLSIIVQVVACSCSSDPDSMGAGGASASTGQTATRASSAVVAVSSSSGGLLPKIFHVSGVVTDGNAPLEGAIVLQGGGQPALTTGPDGKFDIELTTDIPGQPTIVATKI